MRGIVFVVLIVLVFGVIASPIEICRTCMNQTCPENSVCTPVSSNGQNIKACVCSAGFVGVCKNTTDGNRALTCFAAISNSSSCGGRNCNDDQVCSLPDTNYAKCVCKNVNMVVNDDGNCVCRDGLTWDEEQQTCVADYPTSCELVECAEDYVCKLVPVPGSLDDMATCVPDLSNATILTCGVNFRCPDQYQCIQTDKGPSCVCQDGWGGVNCEKRTCYQDGVENCPEHSTCFGSADGLTTPVCVCDEGWFGPFCNRTNLSCENITCPFANTECVEGKCKCTEGYVPDFESQSCVPASTNNTNCMLDCTGNSVCASITSEVSRCVCLEAFGGIDCSKPSCQTSDQCGNNQVCMTHTQHNIPPFCMCKLGWTGENCDIPADSCECASDDKPHTVCSNEGTCVCQPGWYGEDCSEMKTVNCSSYIVTVNGTNSTVDVTDEEDMKSALLDFLGIDNSNLDVFDPRWINKKDMIIAWTVRICGDITLDDAAAGLQLINGFPGASNSGLEITGVSEGETAMLDSVSSLTPFFVGIALIVAML